MSEEVEEIFEYWEEMEQEPDQENVEERERKALQEFGWGQKALEEMPMPHYTDREEFRNKRSGMSIFDESEKEYGE